MRVVVAGGGTAGHIEPAMNLADELMRRDSHTVITALGTARGMEVTLIPERGYSLELIPAVPMPRKINFDLLTLPLRLYQTVKRTRDIIESTNADVVVGFGGYVSMPAYFAARGRVPIVIHEANARAGLANRIGARFADRVAESFVGSLPSAVLTGIPLRRSIEQFDKAQLRDEARTYFGIKGDDLVVLVFGGSQGAARLNSVLRQVLESQHPQGIVFLHAFGPKNEPVSQASPGYIPVPYISRMDLAYAASDFTLCRSGAMTVAEVTAVGLPACFVPLPIGNGEQSLNAAAVVAAGGAIACADEQFTASFVVDTVLPIVRDRVRREHMSSVARKFGNQDASARLADLVTNVVQEHS